MIDHADKTDEDIVNIVCDHDQELYEVLMTRYQAKLLRYITYLIHDEQKAKDVAQESFIKAFINLRSFNTEKKFSAWLYRIAHNEAMNTVKKYRKEIRLPEFFDVKDEYDIEQDLTMEELRSHVRDCLALLPLIYAEPLMLKYLEDNSYEEISYILRIPLGTVGTRISRAKKLMKLVCQN